MALLPTSVPPDFRTQSFLWDSAETWRISRTDLKPLGHQGGRTGDRIHLWRKVVGSGEDVSNKPAISEEVPNRVRSSLAHETSVSSPEWTMLSQWVEGCQDITHL